MEAWITQKWGKVRDVVMYVVVIEKNCCLNSR